MVCANCDGRMDCRCLHHKVVPLSIMLIGVVFILQQAGVVDANFTSWAWPILITAIGIMKLSRGICGCCGNMKK